MQMTPNISLKSGKVCAAFSRLRKLKPANDFNESKPEDVDVFSRPNIPSLKTSAPLPLLENPM